MVWAGDLLDVEKFSFSGEDLFLRLAHSELGETTKRVKLIISFTTISGVILLGAFMYGLHRWKTNRESATRRQDFDLIKRESSSELPAFDFKRLKVATNSFSETNKLGGGGFGPVYKGKLEDGQEIAVKRLSSHSGQGADEFKNEITLISKLQHWNLVSLLGYCIEGEEKLLIYEHLSNRSLDAILFGWFDNLISSFVLWCF